MNWLFILSCLLATAFFAGIVNAVPMGSSAILAPRYAMRGWPGNSISNETHLFLNVVQALFRGVWQDWLPKARPANPCTPLPMKGCCPTGWTQIGSSCYTVLPPATLAAQRIACASMGRGHLLDINSYDENTALLPYLQNQTCDPQGCLVGYADQYAPPETWNGNQNYVLYQTPCAGNGLIQVEAAQNLEMPCNIVYAGNDDMNPDVLNQIKCAGADTSVMIAVCELELDGDPGKFTPNYPMCMTRGSAGGSD